MRGDATRVLIVGAGIAGLAAARTLRGWAATVDVIERAPTPTVTGTGIYLPANAVQALATLGLRPQVAARAVQIHRQEVTDQRGRRLFDVDLAAAWHDIGPCLAVHRADLHQALLAGAQGVPIRWGCTPLAITDHDGAVSVDFSDGTTGTYDLVVGADGVHSTVRRLAFGGQPARPVGQYAHRFVVPWPDPAPVWTARLGRHSTFLTIPIGDGRVYCYCDGPATNPPPPLRDLLAGYAEPVPTLLDTLHAAGGDNAPHSAPIEEVVLDTWSHGCVLLIGDAAHATSPNMAQGAAMALEDAAVLTESLTTAASIPTGLRTYEARRRPRTNWVLTQTHRRDRTRSLPPAIRNLVLRHAGQHLFHANYRPLCARSPPPATTCSAIRRLS